MWSVVFSRQAQRALLRMPRDQAVQVRRRIDEVAQDPRAARDIKKLTDQPGYRMRVGDWRVVYSLDRERIVVQIIRIAHRKEAYR